MKEQTSIRLSAITREQIRRLASRMSLTQTEVILLAVDRLAAQMEAKQ